MEIEIVTTKKKLSKSIIMQMPHASRHTMRCGSAIGYVIGARKDSYKTGIIKHNDEYYWFAMNWSKSEKGNAAVYRNTSGRYVTTKKFNSEKFKDDWWSCYEDAKAEAEKTHIYI